LTAISCGGVWQSHNGGESWELTADGMKADYLPAGSAQDPNTMVVTRTDDGGKSFTVLDKGLPAHDAYHLVYRHSMELAPDWQTLALSSTTGGLWISPDAGDHWHCLSLDLPPVAALGWVRA
jgi:hypothetical protein